MAHASPSALITENGQRVLLRIEGRFHEMSQQELRALLGLPAGSRGLGISIDGEHLEFTADSGTVKISARQLQRRLSASTAAARSSRSRTG